MLDTEGCETLIALTYGCDLAWFERMIGRPLRAAGVRRFLVFGDHGELSATIERQIDLVSGAGRWYAAEGIRAAGRERRLHFASLVEQSRVEYLDRLRRQPAHGAERLLEDLLLLMIAAHRGVRSGALSAFELQLAVVPTLREFIGRSHAPFIAALLRDATLLQDRRWRAWSATTIMLLVYNACLAHLESAGTNEPIDLSVPEVGPVLWLRNVVRAMNLDAADASLDLMMRQLPRLRRLGLWLGDVVGWKRHSTAMPFHRFFEQMIVDARAIEHASRWLPKPIPKLSAGSEDGDVHVVGFGRDGQVAIGFQDEGTAVACLRDGAFQREENPQPPWERMHRTRQACRLDRLARLRGERADVRGTRRASTVDLNGPAGTRPRSRPSRAAVVESCSPGRRVVTLHAPVAIAEGTGLVFAELAGTSPRWPPVFFVALLEDTRRVAVIPQPVLMVVSEVLRNKSPIRASRQRRLVG